MEKSPDAFRTISEVAEWLDVPAHVLRFWESRFTQVKPVKRAGGRRYYRRSDMDLLDGIRKLLHDDGMTIRAVQQKLREDGVKSVAALARPMEFSDGGEVIRGTFDRDRVDDADRSDTEAPPLAEATDAATPADLADTGTPAATPEHEGDQTGFDFDRADPPAATEPPGEAAGAALAAADDASDETGETADAVFAAADDGTGETETGESSADGTPVPEAPIA
jgi:DNA-binding transcriptional MerR regulator